MFKKYRGTRMKRGGTNMKKIRIGVIGAGLRGDWHNTGINLMGNQK